MQHIFFIAVLIMSLVSSGHAQSSVVQTFYTISEGYSADGGSIVVTDTQTDIIDGTGGATGLGFLYQLVAINVSTSLSDPEQIESFNIFPNPIRSGENLNMSMLSYEQMKINVDLFSLNGRFVARLLSSENVAGQWNSNTHIGNISSGKYVLVMRKTSGETIAISKIIVQ